MTGAVDNCDDPTPVAGQNPLLRSLHCQLQPSAWLGAFNLSSHALALAVIAALALYRPWLLLLALVVVISFWHCRRNLRLISKHSVVSLRWHADGTLTWRRRDGVTAAGALVHATVLGRFCVCLRLRPDTCRWTSISIPLAGDSLSPAAHRQLRVRLTLWSASQHGLGIAVLVREHIGRFKALISRD